MGFRIRAATELARGAFLTFSELEIESPDGRTAKRYMVGHPGAVAFLVIDGDEAVFVRQYRSPIDQWLLEVPAGGLESHDTDPRAAVMRECAEEIGMVPATISSLGVMHTSGGITNERIQLFVVSDLSPTLMRPDGLEEEFVELVRIPIAQLEGLIADMTDAKSIVAISRYLLATRD